jgi:hypothetical protein
MTLTWHKGRVYVSPQSVNLTLAAISVLQLLLTEVLSKSSATFSRKFLDEVVRSDRDNELSLPAQPELRQRLLDEFA